MKTTNNKSKIKLDYSTLDNAKIKENLLRIIRENESVEEIENAIKNELCYPGTPAICQSEPNGAGQTMTMIMMLNKNGKIISV
ncbi:MAG: hypothetical protein NTZ83_03860 [Candidatus Pacearchaeota archaeon]|nr:hypothetical protein [Candidatus Pacearchaeota archaeon]